MNLVWKHSKHAGTGRLLMLALADYAVSGPPSHLACRW